MSMPTRVAAVVTSVALAASPTAALAAKAHHHHSSAGKTCAALKRKLGTKAFDVKFGKGPKHTRAMARCVAQHKHKHKHMRKK
jgi:hypothetical protein